MPWQIFLEEFPSLKFLTSCFTEVLQQFPGVKEKWPVSEREKRFCQSFGRYYPACVQPCQKNQQRQRQVCRGMQESDFFPGGEAGGHQRLGGPKEGGETKEEVELFVQPRRRSQMASLLLHQKRRNQMPRQLALPLLCLVIGFRILRSHPFKRRMRKMMSCWLQSKVSASATQEG